MGKSFNIVLPFIFSFIIQENRKVSLNKSKILITLAIYLCEFGINKLGIVNVETIISLYFTIYIGYYWKLI